MNMKVHLQGLIVLAVTFLAAGPAPGQGAPAQPGLGAPQMFAGLSITGTVGTTYQVLYTTNVQPGGQWQVLTNITLTASSFRFIDWDSVPSPKRFYLAVYNPNPDRLVWIPPGTFVMGSPANELDRESDEGPQTTVTLTSGYFIGKYEVTQGEYLAVMGTNPSWFSGNTNLPVEQVSWNEATNYCAQLTARERQAGRISSAWLYRLPTEAEWEYACRAGTSTRFSFGDDPLNTQIGNYAWISGNSGSATHETGAKPPNPWGLFDPHGNVWEWCADWYVSTYLGGSVTNYKGPVSGTRRVVRGGSWNQAAGVCRSANRNNNLPDYRDYSLGLRIVLAPAP
jgi:formylglycine-generating enzyme required for sulfatase activity